MRTDFHRVFSIDGNRLRACLVFADITPLIVPLTFGCRLPVAVAALAIGIAAFTANATAASSPRPPNILLVTADNLGMGDIGCYGNKDIRTPNIDALARNGVRCTAFYTASPTCTVSRATLLTGRYPQRIKLNFQLPGIEGNYGVGLRQSERLIPTYLKPAGYATGAFGKWNIGFAPGSRPTERGFDEFIGNASGNIDYFTYCYQGKHDLHRGTELYDLITDPQETRNLITAKPATAQALEQAYHRWIEATAE